MSSGMGLFMRIFSGRRAGPGFSVLMHLDTIMYLLTFNNSEFLLGITLLTMYSWV